MTAAAPTSGYLINNLLNPSQHRRPSMTDRPVQEQFSQVLPRFRGAYAQLINSEAAGSRRRADMEITGVRKLGRKHMNELYAAAPELRAATEAMMARLGTAGPSRLMQTLDDQAYADLQMGGQLSSQEVRQAEQQARAAMGARGLMMGNQGALAEVLNRQGFTDARRNQRRQFAMGVEQLRGQNEQADRAFTSTAFGQLFQTLDPYRRVFGAYSVPGAQSQTMNQLLNLHGTNASYNLSTNQMLMEDDYRRSKAALDAVMQQEQMQAEQRAGMMGGALGAVGSVIGAFL